MELAQATEVATTIYAWLVSAVPNLIAAVVIAVGGLWIAKWAGRTAGEVIARDPRFDRTLRGVVSALVRYGLTALVVVAVLGQLGFQTTSLIAALGAAGLAIGLALQGTLANVAAGFMLLWLRPFSIGDYIECGDIAGTVREVGLFASELETWDGLYRFVPNSELWNTDLTNYSRHERRLVEVKVGISYGDDIARARDVLMAVATSDERTLEAPTAPAVFVDELGDSAVVMALRVWVRTADYWPALRQMRERAKIEIESAGLTIPFPQLDVHGERKAA